MILWERWTKKNNIFFLKVFISDLDFNILFCEAEIPFFSLRGTNPCFLLNRVNFFYQKSWKSGVHILFQGWSFLSEYILLEYWNKLADISHQATGGVFLIMLEKAIPWYKEEDIQSIVEKIYNAGFKNELANPICDRYARAGFKFLTEIYMQHNEEWRLYHFPSLGNRSRPASSR